MTFNSTGAVSISENATTDLTGTNTAASLALTSETGSINDATGTSLAVTGNANFTANDGTNCAITLGNDVTDTTNFGSLTFNSTGAVSISENSTCDLSASDAADSRSLAGVAGSRNNATATSLTVTGNAN